MPTVNFLWNPVNDNILKEFDEDGNPLVDYTSEPELYGNVVSQHRSGQSTFFHSDSLGSTIAVTDGGGNVTDTQSYSAFGEATERVGTTEYAAHFVGSRGYYTDSATATLEIRDRPFRPTSARWLSRDKLEGLNLYAYTNNNPVAIIDPSGQQCYTTDEFPSKDNFKCDDELVGSTAFRWRVIWKMSAGSNGYILQRIDRTTAIHHCTTGMAQLSQRCPYDALLAPASEHARAEPTTYWELWFVRNGTIIADCAGGANRDFDTWALGDVRDTRGWDDIRGTAFFISTGAKNPCNQPLPGEEGIWAVDPSSPARDLNFTCDPKGVSLKGIRPFASRRMITSWQCCNCAPIGGQEAGITIARLEYRGRCPKVPPAPDAK